MTFPTYPTLSSTETSFCLRDSRNASAMNDRRRQVADKNSILFHFLHERKLSPFNSPALRSEF